MAAPLAWAKYRTVLAVGDELNAELGASLHPRSGFVREADGSVFWWVDDMMSWISAGRAIILGGPWPWPSPSGQVEPPRAAVPQFGEKRRRG